MALCSPIEQSLSLYTRLTMSVDLILIATVVVVTNDVIKDRVENHSFDS
jgi:hypothetical protein